MAEHNELGKRGEELAVEYLTENGYVVLDRNWIFQKAEIDIIAQNGDVLVVVEVKTRSSIDFGLPQDFVSQRKIQLLVKAVNAYVENRNLELSIRFDIISVVFCKDKNCEKPYEIEHLTDAFYHF